MTRLIRAASILATLLAPPSTGYAALCCVCAPSFEACPLQVGSSCVEAPTGQTCSVACGAASRGVSCQSVEGGRCASSGGCSAPPARTATNTPFNTTTPTMRPTAGQTAAQGGTGGGRGGCSVVPIDPAPAWALLGGVAALALRRRPR